MTLDADVAALQARVAALEAQQVGGDTITPTYLTIDAQGHVSAAFSGHVSAQGVDLPEAPNSSELPSSALDWQDAGGTVRQYLQGFESGATGHDLNVSAGDSPGLGSAGVFAQLLLSADRGPGPGLPYSALVATVANGGGIAGPTIIDSADASSFLQLPSPQPLMLATGSGTMPFAGGSGPVTAAVPHGLPRTPSLGLATYASASNAGLFIYVQSFDAANVTFRGVATGAVASMPFVWAAIG